MVSTLVLLRRDKDLASFTLVSTSWHSARTLLVSFGVEQAVFSFQTILMRFTVKEAGGPGGACGLCYELTPVSNTSQLLDKQAMTFMIIDECPASANPSQKDAGRSTHCGQCQIGDVNDFGQPFHFDLAVDAMSKDQYDLFFNGVTGGRYASFLPQYGETES